MPAKILSALGLLVQGKPRTPVRLVVGLGNPGKQYEDTRHNVGFILAEALASKYRAPFEGKVGQGMLCAKLGPIGSDPRPVWVLKPQDFMNRSGRALQQFISYYKLDPECIILHDELTLDLGRIKISERRSAGGHNGMHDILACLSCPILQYRIGIGSKPHKGMRLSDYVLQAFSKEDQATIQTQLPKWVDGLELLLREGPQRAMNLIHTQE